MELGSLGNILFYRERKYFFNNVICLKYYDLNKYFSDTNSFGHFRVFQRNIRSYKRNFDELNHGDFNFKIHCIVLTETWLDNYESATQHPGKKFFDHITGLTKMMG